MKLEIRQIHMLPRHTDLDIVYFQQKSVQNYVQASVYKLIPPNNPQEGLLTAPLLPAPFGCGVGESSFPPTANSTLGFRR